MTLMTLFRSKSRGLGCSYCPLGELLPSHHPSSRPTYQNFMQLNADEEGVAGLLAAMTSWWKDS